MGELITIIEDMGNSYTYDDFCSYLDRELKVLDKKNPWIEPRTPIAFTLPLESELYSHVILTHF
jgi:hypothetical protein